MRRIFEVIAILCIIATCNFTPRQKASSVKTGMNEAGSPRAEALCKQALGAEAGFVETDPAVKEATAVKPWSFTGVEAISSAQGNIIMIGVASWYSESDPGVLKTTASMEIFDDQDLTCAMWGVPFNTLIKVTNISNGKSIIVRVNDRGPSKRLYNHGRIIDLTKKAFSDIADLKEGLIQIQAAILPLARKPRL